MAAERNVSRLLGPSRRVEQMQMIIGKRGAIGGA